MSKIPLVISKDGYNCDDCMFQTISSFELRKHGQRDVYCILFNEALAFDDDNLITCSHCDHIQEDD